LSRFHRGVAPSSPKGDEGGSQPSAARETRPRRIRWKRPRPRSPPGRAERRPTVDPHQKRLLAWVGGGVLGLFALWGAWLWFVERVEVPPGKVLVRIKLVGKNLPEGQVVALSDDHKGIQHEVWGEGRYFLNPFVWTYEIKDAVDVAADECL